MSGQVEILFPLTDLTEPPTRAFYVDGGANQSYGPGPPTGIFGPGQRPHQIGTTTLLQSPPSGGCCGGCCCGCCGCCGNPEPPPRTPGLYYFEVTLANITGNRQVCVGIASVAFALHMPYDTAVNIDFTTAANGVCPIFITEGYGYPDRAISPGALAFASGDTVGCLVDTVNHLFWYYNAFRGGPLIPTHGFDFSANIPTGDIFILVGGAWGGIPPPDLDGKPRALLNAGATPFVGTPPLGYVAWDTTGQTTLNPADADTILSFTDDIGENQPNLLMTMEGHIAGSNKGSAHVRSTTSKQQA